MQLTDADTRLLAALGTDPRTADALAARLDGSPTAIRERLAALATTGLVTEAGGGCYRRTESGRRVLGTSAGARDERLDTSPAVERAIAAFRCSPEAAEAVRHAYTFLRNSRRATAADIVAAVYSERPAGYGTERAWWTDCVRDRLAALPGIAPPSRRDASWRYTGSREASEPFPDGRRVSPHASGRGRRGADAGSPDATAFRDGPRRR